MFLIDDVLAGATKHFAARDKSLGGQIIRQCRNSLRIWGGLFRGSVKQILSRFTWEIVQTVTGFVAAQITNLFRPVKTVNFFHGSTVLEGAGIKGSLCFGTYILLYPERKTGGGVCTHEYGHSLQSRVSGPLYILKYRIYSALRNRVSWVEADANLRSARFFGPDTLFARSAQWRMATDITDPKWWEYALFFLGVGIILVPMFNYQEGV
jgi:hypothetical protein